MALPNIVTRTGKGSALSFAEADANFENLRDAVITVGDGTNSTNIALNGAVTFNSGNGIQITESNGVITVDNTIVDTTNFSISDGTTSGTISDGQTLNFDNNGGITIDYNPINQTLTFGFANPGYISELNDDPSPQLGGNLDVNNNTITNGTGGAISLSTSGGINLSSNGGQISLNATNGVFLQQGDFDANGGVILDAELRDFSETVHDLGTQSGDITNQLSTSNGSVQKVTINGSIDVNGFSGAIAGQSLTLIITQGAGGGFMLNTTSMLFSNSGDQSLSMTSGAIDIVTIFYDGTNYYASIGKDFA